MKKDNSADQLFHSLYHGKRVLFITTKNLDYIRNSQEINLLKKSADSLVVLGSNGKSYFIRLITLYFKMLFMHLSPYDNIFIGFAPQLILPFFYWRLKRKTLTIDFFISFYDTLVYDRQVIKKNTLAAKAVLFFDKATIKKADAIISDTRAHGEYFINELGADPSKLHVVYLEADTTLYYSPKTDNPPQQKDKFNLLYFGSMLPLQGVEVILECAKLLEEYPDIVFDLIGPITEKTFLAYGKLQNVRFTPWLSQQQLAKRIALADLCLAGHFSSTIAKASRTIPGKAYIYKAMGKPLILGDNPANHEVFGNEDTEYFVEMGNPQKLKEMILDIRNKTLNN